MSAQVGGQKPPDSRIRDEEVKAAQEAELGLIGFIFCLQGSERDDLESRDPQITNLNKSDSYSGNSFTWHQVP